MPITIGGIIEEWGEPRQVLLALQREIRDFAATGRDDEEYVVDLAMRSWDPRRPPDFVGVQPGMVGRKQRRFIVWHSVPVGLGTIDEARKWLASLLPDTARLVREYLPTKSKAYPVEDLAAEVDALAAHLDA